MEKRINKKIEVYFTKCKDDICKKITELNFDDKEKMNELIEYVYEYERLQMYQDDLSKRKKIKNIWKSRYNLIISIVIPCCY